MANDVPDAERMVEFFDRRAASYDQHMRQLIGRFSDFYRSVAKGIKRTEEPVTLLDLGCGTGLELEFIFNRAPNCRVTAVDISERMLAELRERYADTIANITLIHASYLDLAIERERWDYIVSVMTMHHLTYNEKFRLYRSIYSGLKPGGSYIEGDYVVTEEEEKECLKRYERLRRTHPEVSNGAYHIDIPFCSETQLQLFLKAGFSGAQVSWKNGQAAVFAARKGIISK
jgi:tRNA (cmo5U34)-methyltransferase